MFAYKFNVVGTDIEIGDLVALIALFINYKLVHW